MKKAVITSCFCVVLIPSFALGAGEVPQLETVTVTATELGETTEGTASYTTGNMKSSTGIALSPRQTPQSVSVVTRSQMDDFNLQGVNDLLEHTTGVVVEQVETDRVYFSARGFPITNFQLDGLGLPLAWDIQHGDTDTAIFDRVEIVRGANGLTTGVGNPSATVNMVRKRPTREFQSSVKGSVGSWDDYRLDADVSGALSEKVGARGVLVQQNRNSYLDNYSQDKTVIYGVTDLHISDETVLTVGGSRQDTRANSPTWGATPLVYSNGEQTDYDESTSTSADWSFWDVVKTSLFAELEHVLSHEWTVTGTVSNSKRDSTAELFYMFGSLDPVTEEGLFGWTGRYETEIHQRMANINLAGNFIRGEREHGVVAGITYAKSSYREQEYVDPGYGFPAVGDFGDWNGDIARPNFDAEGSFADFVDVERAFYVAGRYQALDPLSLIAGVRVSDWTSRGDSYGTDRTTKESGRVVPYAGLVYDLDAHWSAYGSYTEIYRPQSEVDSSDVRLDAVEGDSHEVGLKAAWFEDRLNLTIALFKTRYDGLAEPTGGMIGKKVIATAEDFDSQGYEVELVGEVSPGLQLSVGYTDFEVEDKNGEDARSYAPKQMLRSSFSYRLPRLQAMKVGASLDWQDTVETTGGAAKQDSYALLDGFVSYDFDKNITASLNINNITGEKYLNSLMWDQANYGAPRNIVASITYQF